jgi:hypothetical protein
MDPRAERIGRNEAIFRGVNESIMGLESGWDAAVELAQFVCECGDDTCRERIELSLDEYAQVRADGTQFALVPGHEAPDVESVVLETDRYAVVRKREGGPAELARRLDQTSRRPY